MASQGIVGQVTDRFVVYDAETTSGGSGGPVLNLEGEVVAVNSAILPEFGGSNLGVPWSTGGPCWKGRDPAGTTPLAAELARTVSLRARVAIGQLET